MKRLLLMPVALLLSVVEFVGNLFLQAVCYVAGPLLWFIGACFLFSVFRQEWLHCFLLSMCGLIGVGALFGAGWVLAIVGLIRERLG